MQVKDLHEDAFVLCSARRSSCLLDVKFCEHFVLQFGKDARMYTLLSSNNCSTFSTAASQEMLHLIRTIVAWISIICVLPCHCGANVIPEVSNFLLRVRDTICVDVPEEARSLLL